MATKFKVRTGDDVIVLAGREKGRRGNVIRVLPREGRVVVQGVNMVRRHTRPSQANPQGGILEKEAPLDVSNVAHVDPSDGKPTRVGYRTLDDGRKVRFAKRSGEVIDR